MKTLGISPKAVLAFFFPLISAAVGALSSWIVTGDFTDAEIRTAVSGLALSALALLGAYLGRPGDVVPDDPGVPSDDLLPDEVKRDLAA